VSCDRIHGGMFFSHVARSVSEDVTCQNRDAAASVYFVCRSFGCIVVASIRVVWANVWWTVLLTFNPNRR